MASKLQEFFEKTKDVTEQFYKNVEFRQTELNSLDDPPVVADLTGEALIFKILLQKHRRHIEMLLKVMEKRRLCHADGYPPSPPSPLKMDDGDDVCIVDEKPCRLLFPTPPLSVAATPMMATEEGDNVLMTDVERSMPTRAEEAVAALSLLTPTEVENVVVSTTTTPENFSSTPIPGDYAAGVSVYLTEEGFHQITFLNSSDGQLELPMDILSRAQQNGEVNLRRYTVDNAGLENDECLAKIIHRFARGLIAHFELNVPVPICYKTKVRQSDRSARTVAKYLSLQPEPVRTCYGEAFRYFEPILSERVVTATGETDRARLLAIAHAAVLSTYNRINQQRARFRRLKK